MLVRLIRLRRLGFGHLGSGELPELELGGMQSCFAICRQLLLPLHEGVNGGMNVLELIINHVWVKMT